MQFFTVIILALCLNMHTLAAEQAQVILVKGDVTKLLPGARNASAVKNGEMLPEDTSVLTGDKSVLRLKFSDQSTINLGPKSKIVVSKMDKKKPNMINFLTGVIKSEVKKNTAKVGNKMIIKTRSAVMGIRGTKFQTIYNAENNTTSLVTIEGKVAMVKKTEPVIADTVVEKASTEAVTGEAVKTQIAKVATPEQELAALDKELATSNNTVEVPEGRFSGVAKNAQKPTVPVKIAPQQYNAIAKSMGEEKTAKDVMKVTDADPKPEGFVNEGTGEIAPRAGGMVDFETGLYIPPAKDSKLDEKTGTYEVGEKIGKIDEATGDYVPPKGLVLDANKGFVIEKKIADVAGPQEEEELREVLRSLNEEVATQVQSEDEVESKRSWWKPESHLLSFEYMPMSQSYEVTESEDGGGTSNFLSENADMALLTWKQIWSESFETSLSVGGPSLEVSSDENVNLSKETGGDGEYSSIGIQYNSSKKFSYTFDLVQESLFILYGAEREGSDVVILTSRDIFYLQPGIRYNANPFFGLSTSYFFKLGIVPEHDQKIEGQKISLTGNKLTLGLDATYNWSQSFGLKFIGIAGYSEFTSKPIEMNILSLGGGVNLFWRI